MSRRIALAILVTVWTTVIVGGVAAYWTTRSVLLADLDQTLIARASSLLTPGDGPEEDLAALYPGDRYLIQNELGQTIARAPLDAEREREHHLVGAAFVTLGDGRRMRTITLRAEPASAEGAGAGPLTVIYSGSADYFYRVLNRIAAALLIIGLIAGMGGAAMAVAVARAAIRPLHGAAETIGTLDESRLDRRIDADSLPPELAPIAHRLNEMLAKLESAFTQRKQFLADASHELRTPIAALRTTLEICLRRPRSEPEMRQAMEQCLIDARVLTRLVEGLLEHVRSEHDPQSDPVETIDLTQLLKECADVAAGLGAARDVSVVHSIPAEMRLRTQPRRLRTVVMNLLANARPRSSCWPKRTSG